MKMLPILLLLLLSTGAHSQATYDWSLEGLCNWMGAQFIARGATPGVGDRCVDMKIDYNVEDDLLAMKLCREYVPYHITRAVRDLSAMVTICDAETGLICKAGWIQLYGRCFKMEKKLMFHEDAKTFCKNMENSEIAFVHRDIMAVHWKDYYNGVSRIWMEASEVYRDDLIYNRGNNTMLVFDGMFYGVKSFSMIRVDGKVEKAMVLCEYTPPMTREESGYLVRRYAEIYHPGFANEEGMFLRTAGHFHLNAIDTRSEEAYCREVMKPFISTSGNTFSAAYPSTTFVEMYAEVAPPNTMEFIRTPAKFRAGGKVRRENKTCIAPDFRPFTAGFTILLRNPDTRKNYISNLWKQGQPIVTCDGGHWSTAIRADPKTKKFKMETFSDARTAPLYCQVSFGAYRYGDCPAGYTTYERNTGKRWCRKAFREEKTFDDAEAHCVSEGGHLDGYDSEDEYRSSIDGDLYYSYSGCAHLRLGARRRSTCLWKEVRKHGYDLKPESECSRTNVFTWLNDVASDPPNIIWNTEKHLENNPSYNVNVTDEQCLEHIPNYHRINDIACGWSMCFMCGQEAPKLPI